jgi:hypothetical protein
MTSHKCTYVRTSSVFFRVFVYYRCHIRFFDCKLEIFSTPEKIIKTKIRAKFRIHFLKIYNKLG